MGLKICDLEGNFQTGEAAERVLDIEFGGEQATTGKSLPEKGVSCWTSWKDPIVFDGSGNILRVVAKSPRKLLTDRTIGSGHLHLSSEADIAAAVNGIYSIPLTSPRGEPVGEVRLSLTRIDSQPGSPAHAAPMTADEQNKGAIARETQEALGGRSPGTSTDDTLRVAEAAKRYTSTSAPTSPRPRTGFNTATNTNTGTEFNTHTSTTAGVNTNADTHTTDGGGTQPAWLANSITRLMGGGGGKPQAAGHQSGGASGSDTAADAPSEGIAVKLRRQLQWTRDAVPAASSPQAADASAAAPAPQQPQPAAFGVATQDITRQQPERLQGVTESDESAPQLQASPGPALSRKIAAAAVRGSRCDDYSSASQPTRSSVSGSSSASGRSGGFVGTGSPLPAEGAHVILPHNSGSSGAFARGSNAGGNAVGGITSHHMACSSSGGSSLSGSPRFSNQPAAAATTTAPKGVAPWLESAHGKQTTGRGFDAPGASSGGAFGSADRSNSTADGDGFGSSFGSSARRGIPEGGPIVESSSIGANIINYPSGAGGDAINYGATTGGSDGGRGTSDQVWTPDPSASATPTTTPGIGGSPQHAGQHASAIQQSGMPQQAGHGFAQDQTTGGASGSGMFAPTDKPRSILPSHVAGGGIASGSSAQHYHKPSGGSTGSGGSFNNGSTSGLAARSAPAGSFGTMPGFGQPPAAGNFGATPGFGRSPGPSPQRTGLRQTSYSGSSSPLAMHVSGSQSVHGLQFGGPPSPQGVQFGGSRDSSPAGTPSAFGGNHMLGSPLRMGNVAVPMVATPGSSPIGRTEVTSVFQSPDGTYRKETHSTTQQYSAFNQTTHSSSSTGGGGLAALTAGEAGSSGSSSPTPFGAGGSRSETTRVVETPYGNTVTKVQEDGNGGCHITTSSVGGSGGNGGMGEYQLSHAPMPMPAPVDVAAMLQPTSPMSSGMPTVTPKKGFTQFSRFGGGGGGFSAA